MNILLTIGVLLIFGYIAGLLLDKISLPRIIGYIAVGIIFSPSTFILVNKDILEATQPIMDICLSFIAFEVGGALKWSRIREHEKEIISITLLASFFPYLFITIGIFAFYISFPGLLYFDSSVLLSFAILLGALSSSTAPAATLAVLHQYKARGKVSDTILGIAALDDVLGILLFSLTLGAVGIIEGGQEVLFENAILNSFYKIISAILIGVSLAFIMKIIAKLFKINTESQWVIVLFALIILCVGISQLLNTDEILANMTMGVVIVNKFENHRSVFRILERYTEEFVFLFFFLLSGLHLDALSIPHAVIPIAIFVILRIVGKFTGAYTGAWMVRADRSIQRYTAGGLLPQGGIVIGLVLSVCQKEQFSDISEILLTTIMGATIINELIGPFAARYSLFKSGEIKLK